MIPCCPTCHQPVRETRLGVRLSPIKAALVDAIKAAGDIGITSRELVDLLGRPKRSSLIRVHAYQINDILEETDWRIVSMDGRRFGRWQLVKRTRARAA